MPTPFPGMDPYLEHPTLWPDLHNSLIAALSDAIAPQIRPRYYVAVEERIYTFEPGDLVLAGRADVAVIPTPTTTRPESPTESGPDIEGILVDIAMPDLIRETYLEVRAVTTDDVVTVIEILSPTNKRAGEGRDQYLRKRRVIISSLTHLIEIDLLRSGEPMPVRRWTGTSDYRIIVSRADQRPQALLLPFGVRQAIPRFRLPLYPGDPAPLIELSPILHALYDRRGYDLRLDYHSEAEPPLDSGDAAWADELLHTAGLR
jgi:hypothetical protein